MHSETTATATAAPRRRLHPLTLVFEAIRIGRAFVLPALAAAVGTADDGISRTLTVGLGILAGPALLAALARYFGFRYRHLDHALIIDSGLISRRRRVIPVARIQNIDVRQNVLQRVCGVAELRVETAGGSRTEAVLAVLSRSDADALRLELLAGRHDAEAVPEPQAETLARLSTADLALAGATSNQIGLAAAGIAGALQLLEHLPLADWPAEIEPETLVPAAPTIAIAAITIGALLLILLAGWMLSVVGAVIGYHGFTLERTGSELHKRYGLLARWEGSLPLHRVQAIRIEESLLRRPLGLAAIRIETAGATPGRDQNGGTEAFVPLIRHADVPTLVARVLDEIDYSAVHLRPVHPRARRRIFRRLATPIVLAAGLLALALHPGWLALLVLLPPARLLASLQYRNRGYTRQNGYLIARSGFFNRITCIMPERKIQTLHLSASPFQRRHGLTTLIAVSAGGPRAEARVRDLSAADAHTLLVALTQRT